MNILHINKNTFFVALIAIFALGLTILRDVLFASKLGISGEFDLYVLAFKIPDVIFIILSSFIAGTILLPFFQSIDSERLRKEILGNIFLLVLIFGSIFISVLYFYLPYLSTFFYTTLDNDSLDTLIKLSRILTVQVFLLLISTFFLSILQYNKRFIIFSLAPFLYTLGAIIGVIFFYDIYGINGLIYGILLGSLMHLFVQIPILIKLHAFHTFKVNLSSLRLIIQQFIKSFIRTISTGIAGFSLLAVTVILSTLGTGAVSLFYFAEAISLIPFKIIGISYSSVSFPTLVSSFSEKKLNSFVYYSEKGLISIFSTVLFLCTALFIFAEPVLKIASSLDFFAKLDLVDISVILKALVFTTLGISLLTFVMKIFYAANKIIQIIFPIILSILYIGSTYFIVKHYDTSEVIDIFVGNVFGATSPLLIKLSLISFVLSIFSILISFLAIFMLKVYFNIHLKKLVVSFLKNVFACALLFLTVIPFLNYFEIISNSFFYLIVCGLIATCAWIVVLILLKDEEILSLIKYIKTKWI